VVGSCEHDKEHSGSMGGGGGGGDCFTSLMITISFSRTVIIGVSYLSLQKYLETVDVENNNKNKETGS